MTQLTADFEAGVLSNNIQAADAGSANAWNTVTRAGASTIIYDNTHVAHGSLAAKINNGAASACWLEWSASLGTPTEHYGRVNLYLPSIPVTNNPTLIQCLGPASAVAWFLRLNITTGTVTVFYAAGSDVVFSSAVPTGQWVRLEYHCIHSATVGQFEAKLFNSVDSTSPDQTFSSTANKNTLASLLTMRHGQVAVADSGYSLWMDDIVAGAVAYPGPAGSSSVSGSATGGVNFPTSLII
jgi:hypothetical protein